jgi:hypothetical protein
MKRPGAESSRSSGIRPRKEDGGEPTVLSRRRFLEASLLGSLIGGFLPVVPPATNPLAAPENSDIKLKVAGNEKHGYSVMLLSRGQPIAFHKGGGEFSAIFQNRERTWKIALKTGKLVPGTVTQSR